MPDMHIPRQIPTSSNWIITWKMSS